MPKRGNNRRSSLERSVPELLSEGEPPLSQTKLAGQRTGVLGSIDDALNKLPEIIGPLSQSGTQKLPGAAEMNEFAVIDASLSEVISKKAFIIRIVKHLGAAEVTHLLNYLFVNHKDLMRTLFLQPIAVSSPVKGQNRTIDGNKGAAAKGYKPVAKVFSKPQK